MDFFSWFWSPKLASGANRSLVILADHEFEFSDTSLEVQQMLLEIGLFTLESCDSRLHLKVLLLLRLEGIFQLRLGTKHFSGQLQSTYF